MGASLLLGAAAGAGAWAAPVEASAPRVVLRSVEGLTTTRGALDAGISVALTRQTSSMSVRLRLLAADGTLVFQGTQTRGRLDPGAYLFSFAPDLSSLRLKEGVCTLEALVRTAGSPAVTVREPLYVVGPTREPLPVAVVVRFAVAPMRDPAGGFVTDPASEPSARSEAEALARLAAVRPDLHLTTILPSIMLDDWSRAAGGYSLAGTDTAPVSRDTTPATSAASTLDALSETLRSESLTLLGTGYADPALDLLEAIDAFEDLDRHLALGSAVASETLGATSIAGVAVDGDMLPREAMPVLTARGTTFVLLAPDAVRSTTKGKDSSSTPGAYAIVDTTSTALVFDPRASELLATSPSNERTVLGHLFGRLTAKTAQGAPIVAVVHVGPGSSTSVSDLQAMLALLARTGWVRLIDTSTAASLVASGTTVALPSAATASAATSRSAPFWNVLATARTRALALQGSAGPADPDAKAALLAVMTAESAAWASNEPGAAERGASFAAAADERAWSVLSRATLAVPNVTLSGNAGRVPVSVSNGADRPMLLTLRMRPRGLRLKRGSEITFTALPGENIQSVAVDMGSSLSGSVHFELLAGRLTVASGDSTVRASYIDRLAILASVVVVLLLLLWYITRHGRGAIDRLRKAPTWSSGSKSRSSSS